MTLLSYLKFIAFCSNIPESVVEDSDILSGLGSDKDEDLNVYARECVNCFS